VRKSYLETGVRIWKDTVDLYYVADPPTEEVKLDRRLLDDKPE